MPSPLPEAPYSELDAVSLRWDDVCDLLGMPDSSNLPESILSHPPFQKRFSYDRQFFFQGDPTRLPLEAFWLKLSGFACLCRRVGEFYRVHRRPHLSLDPPHIRVRVVDQGFTRLPVRWLFAVEVDEANGSQLLVHEAMPKEMARDIFVPSGDIDPVYGASVMQQWPMGREVSATVLLRSIDRIPDDQDQPLSRGLIQAHVLSEVGSFADCSDHDVFHVSVRLQGSGRIPVAFWGRKVEQDAERGVIVSGITEPLLNASWAQLERAKQQVFSDARARVYRAFHHSCDLYSLGMLLFRSLLLNQRQSLERVQQQIASVLSRLDPLVQGLNPNDHWTLFKRLTERLQEQGVPFYPPSPHIPESLWCDAVILGLRLVSTIPGFGFRESVGATDSKPVPKALENAICQAQHMAEQARIELFDAAARHYDLIRLCDRIVAERT